MVFSPILVMHNNTNMKIQKSSTINPFGGLNFVIEELDRLKIGKILNNRLPSIAKQSKYNWRDIMYSYWSVFYCGGDCAEDLGENFKSSISQIPYFSTPSPDRILGRLKQLSTPTKIVKPKRAKYNHQFAINPQLNDLNLRILKRIFPKSFEKNLILDYDNTICYTSKKDALLTYKKENGYQPGVGFIGSKVVYVENRNGNSTAHVLQEDTLTRMFELLLNHNIRISKFRADSASYNWRTIQTIDKYTDTFYVRARMSQTLEKAISKIKNWKVVGNPKNQIYRGETTFTPFQNSAKKAKELDTLKEYRLVITKEKRRDGQVNIFTSEAFFYSSIITNDFKKPIDDIVFFYNKRGAIEREFEVLKYDFGWNKLPFSNLSQNNVYLLITAICKNIYSYLINHFSKKTKNLNPTFRLKKFIFRFITIPAKWIKHARQNYLKIFGDISFKT
jgi:hypothetical protein